LPTQFAVRTLAVVVTLAFLAGCLAAVANAQEATTPPARTLVATGNGSVKPVPQDRDSSKSIAAAVAKASGKALPLAVADARQQAAALAAATGVTLGALVTVTNSGPSNSYFGPIFYGVDGTFGPGQYCGTIRTRKVTTDAQGKRHVKLRSHRSCRVPATVQRTVSLTFAIG
jgi:uncharacterized protein YggE